MKEELIARTVTKRPATGAGCCMWSPILRVDRSSDPENVAVPTKSVGAGSDETRPVLPPACGALAEKPLES